MICYISWDGIMGENKNVLGWFFEWKILDWDLIGN